MQAFSNATTEPNFVVSQGTPPSPIANGDPSARRNLNPPALPCQFGRRTRTVRGRTSARPLALGSSCAHYDIEMGRRYARIFCAIQAVGAYFLPSPPLLFLSWVLLLPGGLPFFFLDPHAIGEGEWSLLALALIAVTANVFRFAMAAFLFAATPKSELSDRPTFSQSTSRESPVNFRFPFRSPHDIFAIAGEPSCPSIK